MNENKKKKLQAHLQNIVNQLEMAKIKLGYSVEEQQASKWLSDSLKSVEYAIELVDKIKTQEQLAVKTKKKSVRLPERTDLDDYDEFHKSNVIIVSNNKSKIFSKMCRYLVIEKDLNGNEIDRRCKVHYDINSCGDYCPYHTENAYKTRSKPYGEKL